MIFPENGSWHTHTSRYLFSSVYTAASTQKRMCMRLTSIELIGFKSFQEKTLITLPEGVCAIVGPNGCGKSNIVDAILWVLGAQSAKVLRGEKMTDVIFAGSKSKKKAHVAEVTLQFDNRDGFLPFHTSEISVARRIHRSGESEYFLNRQSVRMRDIQELFATTGLGKEGFSVIGQGQVDSFLMKSSEEKRKLIEEIAGISRFYEKRKEAESHLKASQANIQRATDIHGEVKKQLEKLQQQKEALEDFKKTEEALFLEKKAYEEKRLSLMKLTLQNKQNKVKESEEAIKEIFASEAQMERERRALSDRMHELFRLKDLRQEELQEMKGQKALYQQAEKNILQREEELVKQAEESKKRISLLEGELKSVSLEKKGLEREVTLFHSTILEKERLISQKEAEILDCEEDVRQKEQALFTLKNDLQVLESRWTAILSKKALASQEQEVLLRKQKAYVEGKKEHETSLQKEMKLSREMSSLKSDLLKEIEQAKQLLEEQKKAIGVQEQELFDCEKKAKIAHEEKSLLQAEIHAFQVMQKQFRDSQHAVKKVLEENRKSRRFGNCSLLVDWLEKEKSKITPTVFPLLDAKYSSTLVLETIEEAKRLLAWNEKEAVGALSFLVLELLPHGIDKFLSSLEKFCSSETSFLRREGREAFFVRENLFQDGAGVFFFISQEKGVFSQASELKMKEKEFIEVKQRADFLDDSVHKKKNALIAEKKSYETHEYVMRKSDMRLVEVSMKLSHSEGQMALLKERIAHTDQFIQESTRDLDLVKSRLEDYEKEISSFQDTRKRSQTLHEQKKKEGEGAIAELLDRKRLLKELQGALTHTKESLLKKEGFQKVLEQKWIHSEQEKHKLVALLQSMQEEVSALYKKREEILLEAERSSQQTLHLSGQLEAIKKKIQEGEKEQSERESFLAKIKGKKENALEKKTHLLTSLEVEKSRFEELSASFVQTYGPSSFMQQTSEKELDHLSSSIRSKSDWLFQHQTQNMHAKEEYDECHARFQTTQEELNDLQESFHELSSLIKKLEQESGSLFRETLTILESYFSMNFSHLFPGGAASLVELVGSEEDKKGIELVIELPGKERQSLKMMSGGERCLTALAFLFSLFQARKSPLCLLDEVDAPLDEANVERFCSLLDSCGDTQFLIVTHNKRTMEKSASLLGVTMPEKGISQVLQVCFAEKSMAE